MLGAVLTLTTTLSASAAAVAFSGGADLQTEVVRLADIADLSPLPQTFRANAAALALARLAPGQTLKLDKARLAERVRALLPAAAPWFREIEPGTVLVSRAPAPPASPRAKSCVRAAAPLAQGAYLLPADLKAASCDTSHETARWTYSGAKGRARTRREIATGEVLPAPPAFAMADVRPGQPVRLRVNIGPVVLEREVRAVQAGTVGKALFVRTASGEVFSTASWEPVQ